MSTWLHPSAMWVQVIASLATVALATLAAGVNVPKVYVYTFLIIHYLLHALF